MLRDAPQDSKLVEPSLLHSISGADFCNKSATLMQRRTPECLILQGEVINDMQNFFSEN